MRRLIILLILAGFTAGIPRPITAQETDTQISRENKILEEEWALARKSSFYFLFNLKEKTIELKSRGIVLRKWTAQRLKFWGKPLSFGILEMRKKTALTPLQRRVIKPGEEEASSSSPPPAKAGEFELEALEIKDMPKKYALELEGGTDIMVKPKKKGAAGIWDGLKWHIGIPLKTAFLFLKKRKISLIQISFDDPKEGQAMYWALTEGLKGLIWFPQEY